MRRLSLWTRCGLSLVLLLVVSAGALSQETPVTLTFAWWGNVAVLQDYEAVFERFHELNPDIRVESLHWGWSADAREKYTVAVATNTAPDVFMIPTVFPDALLPLDPYIERSPDLIRQLVPHGVEHWRISMDEYGILQRGVGQQLGLPLYSFATAIAYNGEMFAQAGIDVPTDWTYDDYVRIAQRLTRDTDGDGVPNIWGASWHIQSNTGIGPIIAAHGDWPIITSDPLDTIIDTPSVQNAIDYFRRWTQELQIHPPPARGSGSFPAGTVATIQGHNDTFLGFPQTVGDQFPWDILPMPVGPNGRKSVVFHQGIGINAQTEHPEEAWRFVEFFLSAEGATLQNRTLLRLSSNVDAAQDYLERAPFNASVIFESLQYAIDEQPGLVDYARELYPVWDGLESTQAATERIARLIRARIRELTGGQ